MEKDVDQERTAESPVSREDLERYIQEVRVIKQSLVEAEGGLRITDWFYYVFGAVIAAGTVLNYVLARTVAISMHDSFVFIWLPAFFVGGIVEMAAWIQKSMKEQVPLFTPAFVKYMIAFSGYVAALIVLSFFILRPDFPVPGLVLLLVGMTVCIPMQYTNHGFMFGALFLIAFGVLFILIDGHRTTYFIADGALVTTVFLVSGVFETMLSRRTHG